MADVEWIKLTVGMFDNRKIKHIRKLPEGNNITLIWVMLLTMAGRCNSNGFIYLTENIPYTTKMLADELEFDESVIQMALTVLEKFDMIYRNGDLLSIPGWEEHQNVEGLDRVREMTRKRVAEHRERQKEIEQALDKNCNVTCNVTVTECNRDVTQQNQNQNKNQNKNKKENIKRKDFIPPTVDEVKEYLKSVGSKLDAESFVAFYESKGWMIGKNKMKSWKSAIVTWEKRAGLKREKPISKKTDVKKKETTEEEMTDDEWLEMMKKEFGE